jgi:hypothetical protein
VHLYAAAVCFSSTAVTSADSSSTSSVSGSEEDESCAYKGEENRIIRKIKYFIILSFPVIVTIELINYSM